MSQASDAAVLELIKRSPSTRACRELAAAIHLVLTQERADLAADIYKRDIVPAALKGKQVASNVGTAAKATLGYFSKLKTTLSDRGLDGLTEVVRQDSTDALLAGKKSAAELYEFAKEAIPQARRAAVGFTDRIVADYQSLETDEDKVEYLVKLSMYLLIFAAGVHAGNTLPDMDFKLWGAGAHRSWISHSAVPMLTVTAVSLVMTRLLERAEAHLNHDPEALAYSRNIRTGLTVLTVGFGVGNAFHLVKDSLIDRGGTIRFHNLWGEGSKSMISGTRVDDLSYTAVMSLFSGDMTRDAYGRAG